MDVHGILMDMNGIWMDINAQLEYINGIYTHHQ